MKAMFCSASVAAGVSSQSSDWRRDFSEEKRHAIGVGDPLPHFPARRGARKTLAAFKGDPFDSFFCIGTVIHARSPRFWNKALRDGNCRKKLIVVAKDEVGRIGESKPKNPASGRNE